MAEILREISGLILAIGTATALIIESLDSKEKTKKKKQKRKK